MDPLSDFTSEPFSADGKTRTIYRKGEGPAVIVISEVPGITPLVADFARRVADRGMTTVMPHLFGTPGKEPTNGYAMRTIAWACVSREFTTWARGKTSPAISWCRALARAEHERCGGPGVGVVGMCLTGGFTLGMMVDPSVVAPALSQPSLPFSMTAKQKRDLGVSDADLAVVKQRAAEEDICVLGLRFSGDPMVPEERFARLEQELGDHFVGVTIDSSSGNPWGHRKMAHSVLTEDLIDEPGQPTRDALGTVLEHFSGRLLPRGVTDRGMRARGWGVVLLVALGATVAQAFGRFTYGVLLPAVRDDLGVSNTVAGLFGTVNVGAYLTGTLLIVRATARVRLLTILRFGLSLSISGLVLAGVAPTAAVLAVALVLMGLGGACIWIPSPAIAAAAVPERRRGVSVGMIGAGVGTGIVFAGRLSDVLRQRFGDEAWNDVYLVEAGIGVAVALAILVLLRPAEVEPAPTRTTSGLAVLRTMAGWVPLTLAYASFGFSYLLAITYLTARLEDDAGYSEGRAAAVFAVVGVATIVGGVVLGALADRIGPRRALLGGFTVFSAGAAAILTGEGVAVVGGGIAIGMMFGGLPSVIAAYIVRASDHVTYGPRYAVATLAFGVAQVSSPQVGGFLADLTGSFTVVFALSSVVALLGAVASSLLPRPMAAGS